MNKPFPEFFRYRRDKGSGFGHGANKRDPVVAWEETLNFLNAHTIYELTLPLEINLKVKDGEFDRKLYENIVSLLGDQAENRGYWLTWRENCNFNADIDSFIHENFRYSPGYDYDMSIHLHFNFHWKNLSDELIEDNIEVFNYFNKDGYHGKFSVSIDNRLFIQPEFIVPLSNWNHFHSFVKSLTDDLPFKFKNKSFASYTSKMLKNGKKRFKVSGYYGQSS